jgi:RND superfamily putative drug exporter
MATLLYRLGHSCVRHRRTVLALWLILLVGLGAWAHAAKGETTDNLTIPGTESQEAADLLDKRFPAQSGSTARIVLAAPEGHTLAEAGALPALRESLEHVLLLPGVARGQDPAQMVVVSPDQRVAIATVRFDLPALAIPKEQVKALMTTAEQTIPPVVQVDFGGDAVDAAVQSDPPPSEAIGFAVAVVVLLIAFGSVVAMGLPLLTAVVGVGIGVLGISVLSAFVELSSVAPTLATMIGLAVGIDYALFVVTRHRAFVASGLPIAESAARANATAGGAVVFAGTTVVIALAGLAVVGVPFLTLMGLCAAGTVLVAVLIAVTLIPALLGFAGENIDKLTIPGIKASTGEGADVSATFSGRFAKTITSRPRLFVAAGLTVMIVLALPLLSMRLGLPDDGSLPGSDTQRRAYDLLAEGFGPGSNGPLTLVVNLDGARDGQATLGAIEQAAKAAGGVVAVAPPVLNPAGNTAIVTVVPSSGPSSVETEDLVHRLRRDVLPSVVKDTGATVAVAGTTAANIDISNKLGGALPEFMLFVIGLTALLLLVVFRSILVPIKAAVAILLSIGASLGVLCAVFQWGWAKDVIGIEQTAPIVSFLPLMMFAILFGLSMDYEVFILSRIKGAYVRDGRAHHSVLVGLSSSARVITAAALIMISVFAAFVLGDNVVIKMFGIGLAVAVLLDATVVRMVIVPSVLTLFGRATWWLPRWLRWLPDLDVEGERLLERLEQVDGVAPAPAPEGPETVFKRSA